MAISAFSEDLEQDDRVDEGSAPSFLEVPRRGSVEGFFHRLLALGILILAVPLLLLIAALVWIFEGRPILHRGTRLGLGKQPFTMYKFRTLAVHAHREIGGNLFGHGHGHLISPLGRFLRDTRLDELPQLWNIVRGEMRFIGPRPERPEVSEGICRGIRNYDFRFTVRPGLLGYSQLVTPHGAPKSLRAVIDNRFIARKRKHTAEISIFFFAIFLVLSTAVKRMQSKWLKAISRESISVPEMETQAIERRGLKFRLHDSHDGASRSPEGEVIRAGDKMLCVRFKSSFEVPDAAAARIVVPQRSRAPRIIKCRVEAIGTDAKSEEGIVWFAYEPSTPLNRYRAEQYLLHKSIVRLA